MSKVKTIESKKTAGDNAEQVSVSTPVQPVGICSTCRHQSRCLFFKAARQAIHHCEEFDDANKAGDKANVTGKTIAKPGDVNLEQGQSAGLCTNCDTRLTCMHRKPGETVLKCEDYT